MKEPICKFDCWKCGDCGWLNPYPMEMITCDPPTVCYHCKNCGTRFYGRDSLSASERFRREFPEGKEDK